MDEKRVQMCDTQDEVRVPEVQGIGWAVKQMQNGATVTRQGWNGKGQYLGLMYPNYNADMLPYVWIKTVGGQRVPWLCSQTDLLAVDWVLA